MGGRRTMQNDLAFALLPLQLVQIDLKGNLS